LFVVVSGLYQAVAPDFEALSNSRGPDLLPRGSYIGQCEICVILCQSLPPIKKHLIHKFSNFCVQRHDPLSLSIFFHSHTIMLRNLESISTLNWLFEQNLIFFFFFFGFDSDSLNTHTKALKFNNWCLFCPNMAEKLKSLPYVPF
jgi:hypothetical protein